MTTFVEGGSAASNFLGDDPGNPLNLDSMQPEFLDRSYLGGAAQGTEPAELELTPYAREYYGRALTEYGPGIRAASALILARAMDRYGYGPMED